MAKFCVYCGSSMDDDAKFCLKCGNPAPGAAPATPQQQPARPQPAPQPALSSFTPPGITVDYADKSTFSGASGQNLHYVVLQVTLKEKFIGTGSGNLTELEACINAQAAKGYRLHTITTSNGGSKGMMGGDRIQATMVFEKIV
ncbi:MAG: zinc-ribbon domain-containing protein [Clostridia bacterium]|nr:zinc-ribbon domain-containing protein [Clostridia bacterium]